MTDWFADLSNISVAVLLISSFLGSFITASLGVGGGAFLIAVMAGIVPPLALIPLHGIVQLGSNGSRAVLTRKHIDKRVILFFALGALLASGSAILLLDAVGTDFIPPLIAVFILWLCWGPMPELGLGKKPIPLFIGGWLTTMATMVVGATGPLVSAWLGRTGVDRWVYTANFSSCMTLQHLLKIAVFGLAGFAFTQWIPLLILMIIMGFIGTKVGLKVLGKLPEKHFKFLFKVLLSILAIKILFVWFY
ncbi:sulfite exporter TauE/SafE family protein [Alkalimarinus alittae]|uniref:Probable membrane transporter protein n=1 Tax=Alkalimarinus alittae TaxID=2961619 RepID=A0ABY6N4S9_9ALTE|nr:sulfite exporter TauE/SafE family protein [Alkalimarinus alittae]UZE97045.1 sulfite exporter TauE/SafE family protein [Alkalimarinus alittae]